MLKFSMDIARIQHKHKMKFCFEHPAHASSWKEKCVRAVANLQGPHKLGRAKMCSCRILTCGML